MKREMFENIQKLQKNTEDVTNLAIAMEGCDTGISVLENIQMFFALAVRFMGDSQQLVPKIYSDVENNYPSAYDEFDTYITLNMIKKVSEENLAAKQRLMTATKNLYSLLTNGGDADEFIELMDKLS